jgi:hypothetical protein
MSEHSELFEGFPVVNLSSDEEDAIPDTSRDEDITYKLFGDLNCGLLGPPDDDNVIVINYSEEEEVCENDHVDADAMPSSLRISLAPSASIANDDDSPYWVLDDIVTVAHPIGCKMVVVTVRMEAALLRLSRQKGLVIGACAKEF